MAKPIILPMERVRRFKYDPEEGVVRGQRGQPIGRIDAAGYHLVNVAVDGVSRWICAHRIAWALMTGAYPVNEIDHINGVKRDNRWCNLREATHAQNQQNITRRRSNTSGHPGVTWQGNAARWKAQIGVGGKTRYLGLFKTVEEASAAYLSAKAEWHTFHPTIRGG